MQQSPEDLFLALGDDGAGGLDPNYRYLCGSLEPGGALLFGRCGFNLPRSKAAAGPNTMRTRSVRQLLLLPKSDPVRVRWGEDALETVDNTRATDLGVDVVRDVGGLDAVLAAALAGTHRLWLLRSRPASFAGEPDPLTRLAGRIRERMPAVELRDAAARVDAMRSRKDDSEIKMIERALAVTRSGFDRIAACIAPDVTEGRLEAELSHHYRVAGADHAFGPICAGGSHALQLHYRANAGTLVDGQLVLVDSGARLDGYCSDITRTFPVGGRFSARQREVYETVLEAQRVAIEHCVVGVTLADIHAMAYETIDRNGMGENFVHGIGHPMGLDVHDVAQATGPLEAGAVVTIEPGLYLEQEGLGIRIEDDILITDNGPRVLSEEIPKTVDAVEAWMAGGRA